MFYFYKDGDVVPEWLEKSDQVDMTFATDVMVHKLETVTHIFPFSNTPQLICANVKKHLQTSKPNVRIHGYPTVLHTKFEEFFTDYVIENYTFENMEMRKREES